MASDREIARHHLGVSRGIDANAVGEPGQRRFHLLLNGERGTALLWLGKEQLQELALAIKQVLKKEVKEGTSLPPMAALSGFDHDLEVERLLLGRDEGREMYVLLAYERGRRGRAAVAMLVADEQLDRLADRALQVCASGRPRCPLCGAPMNQGEAHVCVRANGHRQETLS